MSARHVHVRSARRTGQGVFELNNDPLLTCRFAKDCDTVEDALRTNNMHLHAMWELTEDGRAQMREPRRFLGSTKRERDEFFFQTDNPTHASILRFGERDLTTFRPDLSE